MTGRPQPRPDQDRKTMSIEIDVLNGDASWPMAEPLFDAVWPPDVVAKLPWGRHQICPCRSAGAGRGARRRRARLPCRHLLPRRHLERPQVRIGGIGGVATREDCRRRGYASIALNAAVQTLRDEGRGQISRCCSASRTISHSTRRAAGIRSTARSTPSSRQGRVRFEAMAPFVLRFQARAARRHDRPMRPAVVTPARPRGGAASGPPIICRS